MPLVYVEIPPSLLAFLSMSVKTFVLKCYQEGEEQLVDAKLDFLRIEMLLL